MIRSSRSRQRSPPVSEACCSAAGRTGECQPANLYFGQVVIVTKSIEARNRVKPALEKIPRKQFVDTDTFVKTLELGPPVGRPIQYRIGGPDIQKVLAETISSSVHAVPYGETVRFMCRFPFRERSRAIKRSRFSTAGVSSGHQL